MAVRMYLKLEVDGRHQIGGVRWGLIIDAAIFVRDDGSNACKI